ncbi:MAG: SWIM zinc finger family protein [Kiritimatiellae bacterium]|nr:SWIM zinc finger family protein [Kiritimatiellia bacterium]
MRIPRHASGIRAQESRTGSGRSWWSRRWLATLEQMGLGARLGRGRNYAMSGQVVSISIEGPRVLATVVGSRPDPYSVSVVFRAPEGDARSRIVARLKAEPMLVARMLADDLPTEVEAIFRDEGWPLFPGGKLGPGRYDMTTKCSCPDYANPCKHSSAVLLLLGEEIARRPATLVELRGITMEELYDED